MGREVKKVPTVGGVTVGRGAFGYKVIRLAARRGLSGRKLDALRALRDDALTIISPSQKKEARNVLNALHAARRSDNWP